MKLVLGCGLLVTLGLVSCGGTSGSTTVSGNDPASIKAAPAGVSTLTFMDLELVRPDNLAGSSALPTGVRASLLPGTVPLATPGAPEALVQPLALTTSPATLTFTNCKAANGGVINGTIVVTWPPAQNGVTTFTEAFHLTVTPTTNVATPAQTWVYQGQQVVAVNSSLQTATLTMPAPGAANAITATFTDNTVSPAAVKVYQVSTDGLTVNWSVPGVTTLAGDYKVAQGSVEAVTVTLGPPLTWTAACGYPTSGTLTLGLVSATLGNDSTTVVFGPACSQMTIAGVNFTLGQ